MMHILQLDTSFLEKDVESWPGCAAFLASSANVLVLNVINDYAERGVKLSSDKASARTEQHHQNVLQVVEQDRQRQPNIRKRKHY